MILFIAAFIPNPLNLDWRMFPSTSYTISNLHTDKDLNFKVNKTHGPCNMYYVQMVYTTHLSRLPANVNHKQQ